MSPKAVILRLAGAIAAALTGSAIIAVAAATSSMAMAADLAIRIAS